MARLWRPDSGARPAAFVALSAAARRAGGVRGGRRFSGERFSHPADGKSQYDGVHVAPLASLPARLRSRQ
jgi:hypothetical protein